MAEKEGTDTSGNEDDEETEIETLVAGRAKRSTAANRYSTLLEQEAGDDDLNLLFADDEVEEDAEFEGEDGEAASDIELGSSDDDDQGPTAGANDLEGENEIARQEKAERKKKRKAQDIFRRPLAKTVKVDPTAGRRAPAARPKKKSERVSWLPTENEGPVRASRRVATVKSGELTTQRIKDDEVIRRQNLARIEKSNAQKPQVKRMTQEDRLAEAARTEKQNAKSLNHWETEEKRRQEEQQARLDALKSRKLEGPFISLWSGQSTWLGEKLVAVGSGKKAEEIQESKKQSSPKAKRKKSTEPAPRSADGTATVEPVSQDVAMNASAEPDAEPVVSQSIEGQAIADPTTEDTEKKEQDLGMPDAPIAAEPAIMPDVLHLPVPEQTVLASASPVPTVAHTDASAFAQPSTAHTETLKPESSSAAASSSIEPAECSIRKMGQPPPSDQTVAEPLPLDPPPPPPPEPAPLVKELAVRNLAVLENVDGNAAMLPELRNHVLMKSRKAVKVTAKQQKVAQELCVITGQPAHFRDPLTGLAYAMPYAYDEIQKLCSGGPRWSDLLGCYVGPRTTVARGVPEGFCRRP